MMGRMSRVLLGLLLLLTGLAPGLAGTATAAGEEPTLATPRTLHYEAELTLTMEGLSGSGSAVGDFDFARPAFHVKTTTRVEDLALTIEMILLDGRLYIFNPDRDRWEYRDLGPADLAEAAPPPRLATHPTASYTRAGSEPIGGVQTARWRASNDFNLLTVGLIGREFGGILLEETLTVEAWIGAADRFLYRQSIVEAGKVTGLGSTAEPPSPVASETIYRYSNVNQPVTIVAPAGAVPAAAAPPGLATLPGGTAPDLIARALLTGLPFTPEALAQRLLPGARHLP